MSIRILHVVETMLGMGGMEKGVVNLIQHMDPSRFEHVVCVIRSLGDLSECLPRDRTKVLCLGHTTSGFRFLAPEFVRLIREIQPDIVHSRNRGTFEALLAGYWIGGCSLVHSEHGVESIDSHSEPWRRRQLRRLVFSLADQVCTVSHHLREYHALHVGFPAHRIKVIHNGVDTLRFQPQIAVRESARLRLGIAPDEFCIGAVGRLEPIKDIATLLRAVAEMGDAARGYRVLIAGDGGEAAGLREYVRTRPELNARVLFLGEIQEIPELLNALDVYVLPSLYEGICNSLLEAMAVGLPVIATAAGGNPEVIDNQSGILFPVGDASALAQSLQRLRQQEDLRARLSREAIHRIHRQFSLASMVAGYEALYASLTNQPISGSTSQVAAQSQARRQRLPEHSTK